MPRVRGGGAGESGSMRRKIFTTASLLSLLLFVTAASLWAYSFGKEVSFGNADWSRSFRVERSYFVYSRLLNIPRFYSKSWRFPGIAFRAINVSDSRTTRPGAFRNPGGVVCIGVHHTGHHGDSPDNVGDQKTTRNSPRPLPQMPLQPYRQHERGVPRMWDCGGWEGVRSGREE